MRRFFKSFIEYLVLTIVAAFIGSVSVAPLILAAYTGSLWWFLIWLVFPIAAAILDY